MQVKCRFSLLTVVVALLISSTSFVVAATQPPGMKYFDADRMMTASQLKRGMKGYALTVFQGTNVEKFDVEILGVLKQANQGQDYILVRIAGGPITSRGLGVASGMSGSPVYINGKLIGAVSAALQWSKEPIGMVTPITDMLEALDGNLPARASGYSSVKSLDEPVVVEGRSFNKMMIDSPGTAAPAPGDDTLRITPIATPVTVSGMSAEGLDELQKILAPYNLKVMQGGGSGGRSAENANPDLVPGAAVGVALATGDIDMTATGTVTYRLGEKLLGFGHPFLGVGAIDAPMTTAYVVDVLSTYNVSTKLAVPLRTVGRVFQDRPWSIAGSVGETANTIPVRIDVDDQTTKRKQTFNVKIVDHPMLAPQLAGLVVRNAVQQIHSTPGDATATVSYQVVADKLGPIKQSNVFFDQAAIEMEALTDFSTLVRILSANQFEPLDIKSVDVKVQITDRRNTATIDRIFVKKSDYSPGETVDVGVVLRPYKKERLTRTFSVKIPATAQSGKVILQVRGGGSPDSASVATISLGGEDGAVVSTGGSAASADNVKQLVDKFLEKERNDQLVVQLLMPSTALNIAGEKLSGLPSTIADIMKSSKNSGLKLEREEVKSVFDEEMIITGSARLQIDIKQNSAGENKPASSNGKASSGSSAAVPLHDYDGTEYVMAGSVNALSLTPTADGPSVTVVEKPADSDGTTEASTQTASEAEKEEDKPADAAQKTDVKTVVRQPQTWSQRSQADFSKGTFEGVATSSENKIVLTPTMTKLVETSEQFVWCVAPAGGGVYAGTGNSGKVFRVSEAGELSLFAETGELQVHALVVDADGNVYAGTSPNGKVFRISPDGKSRLVLDAEEKYVVSMAVDSAGNVYAGVGDAGRIYRITRDGESTLYATTSEQQILSLAWDRQGFLIAGTGINGVVYKVTGQGKAAPVFDAPEEAVSSVTSDGKGTIYAGTSPKGVVYKIAQGGHGKPVFTAAARVLSMSMDDSGNLYAVSDGTLVKITPDATVIQLDSAKDSAQYLALAHDNTNGLLYAGTGNIGSIYVSKRGNEAGTFLSAVHDTKMFSRWGRIKWIAETPQGTSVEIQTRTGNVDTPDATWSGWSRVYTNGNGEQIDSTDARYIQYRATLKSAKPGISPMLSSISLSYLTPNQQPTVKITEPAGGSVLSGKKAIKWTGSDPDKDKLTYDVYYSADGISWTAIVGGMKAGKEEKILNTEDISKKVKNELEKSPDVPQDMKDAVLKNQDSNVAAASESANRTTTGSSTSTSYDWDTSKVADGSYFIKVQVSDRTSNAVGALTNDAVTETLIVCNTAPELSLLAPNTVKLDSPGPGEVLGTAQSALVSIAGVQFRVDGGEWMAAAAEDGIFDSPIEQFSLNTEELASGKHKIEIQAVDAAGNASTKSVDFVVK